MSDFNECLYSCGLFDLSGGGRTMSWCNGQSGVTRSWANLDRVVINNAFLNQFVSSQLVYLSLKSLDHCPMVIYLDRPFYKYG